MRERKLRVLYSFPHKLGAGRICYTAWHQVNGIANAGADVLVFPGVLHKQLPRKVKVQPTLARGRIFIPYKLLGTMRACALHDYIVARRIEAFAEHIDIIHAWPLGSLRTLKVAAKFGIPAVLERPNTHTRFGYDVVNRECERLGVTLPSGDNHTYNFDILSKEEHEYQAAYRLLCPSDFVLRSFIDQGFSREKLVRHAYGYDDNVFFPEVKLRDRIHGFTLLFVGVCGVVKGLHYALEAWLKSPAHYAGLFLIAGEFEPGYAEKLSPMLADPSVRLLGHCSDVGSLMRRCDALILPSITEGFGLVCAEAMGSGCVPLVSSACTDICINRGNSLVHPVGDVGVIAEHITALSNDRALFEKLRAGALETAPRITWDETGVKLLKVYAQVVESYRFDSGSSNRQYPHK